MPCPGGDGANMLVADQKFLAGLIVDPPLNCLEAANAEEFRLNSRIQEIGLEKVQASPAPQHRSRIVECGLHRFDVMSGLLEHDCVKITRRLVMTRMHIADSELPLAAGKALRECARDGQLIRRHFVEQHVIAESSEE